MKTKIKQYLKILSRKFKYFTPNLEIKHRQKDNDSFLPFTFFRWFVACCLWVFTISAIYVLYVFHDLPSIDNLEELHKNRKVTILDSSGNILANFGDLYGHYVNYYEIPRNLRNAVIATEDRKFFNHYGVDPIGILRAAIANLRAGHTVQGGSTITQQLAKIVFLSPKRTLKRKLQEALLAVQLEYRYSKQRLFSIYLNRVYLGAGLYGIDSAAKYYFGKNVDQLNLYESAIIAGLLKAPSKFSPTNNPMLAGQRAYQVLLNMYDEGYISKKQLMSASKNPVKIETRMLGSIKKHYFTRWVYDQIPELIDDQDSNLIVKTTLNLKFQKIAQSALTSQLDKIAEKRKVEQGAVVLIGEDGKILAMVGGRDFGTSPYNRATQSKRQAGSAFKIFVYAAAMEAGYNPADKMIDEPINFGDWSPQNFHKNFLGEITLNEAFKKSINTVAVKLASNVGVGKVRKIAKMMGINEKIQHDLSIALGSPSVTLLEMTAAYSTIANNGFYNKPFSIEYIAKADNGKLLYQHHISQSKRVLKEDSVYNLDRMLTDAVRSGTSKKAYSDFKISAKTGTSQDFRDAWFLGYSGKTTIGVWLGNDDYSPTKWVSGGTFPALIARDILRKIHPNTL